MSALNAIILAAGRGTRMKSETAKVLHLICGRPMIHIALDIATSVGVKQPLVVLSKGAQDIKARLPKDAKVVIQSQPLGTGDAVLAAKRLLGSMAGDLLILYADTPLLRRSTVHRLIETHRKANATCTLLAAHLANPTGYGRIVRDANAAVSEVVEEVEANMAQRAIREINVGPICAKASALFEALSNVKPGKAGKEWYLTQAVELIAQQPGAKIQTARVESATEAEGVNSRIDLAKATTILRERILEQHMLNGVTLLDPKTTYIDFGVTIGQDTLIAPGTVIESGVTIGKRCAIGPYAHLRHGVTVADDARIGNFAELVRTSVGHRVRVNHMSYLGDTTIDDDVNIGAGTITANYDGEAKHPTKIGKGAFIGSDTILIAPVEIGQGAVTGAGSVVPKEHHVPPRGVVAGVPARLLNGKAAQPSVAAPRAKARATPKAKRASSAKPKSKSAKPASRPKAKPKAKARARR